jgi:hypothetical protein
MGLEDVKASGQEQRTKRDQSLTSSSRKIPLWDKPISL